MPAGAGWGEMQHAHTVRPTRLTPHYFVPFAGNVAGVVPVRLWHHSPALQQQALKCLHAWLLEQTVSWDIAY